MVKFTCCATLLAQCTPICSNTVIQHDLTKFSVFVEWCSWSFCFHQLCPKPLDWIGAESNWFSLTFSKSTFQTIPVVACPPSTQHSCFCRIQYCTTNQSFTVLFFNSDYIFPLSNCPRLLNASFTMARLATIHKRDQSVITSVKCRLYHSLEWYTRV